MDCRWRKWNRVITTVDGSEHRLDVQNLVNDGIFSILTGAQFLPATVSVLCFSSLFVILAMVMVASRIMQN